MLNCTQAEKCTSARTASSQGGRDRRRFSKPYSWQTCRIRALSKLGVCFWAHDLRYCDGCLILGWHSLRVLRENIRHDKHIISPVSSRFKQLFLPQDERLWRWHIAESSDSGSLYQLLSLANNNAAWLGKSFVPAPGAHGCHSGYLEFLLKA